MWGWNLDISSQEWREFRRLEGGDCEAWSNLPSHVEEPCRISSCQGRWQAAAEAGISSMWLGPEEKCPRQAVVVATGDVCPVPTVAFLQSSTSMVFHGRVQPAKTFYCQPVCWGMEPLPAFCAARWGLTCGGGRRPGVITSSCWLRGPGRPQCRLPLWTAGCRVWDSWAGKEGGAQPPIPARAATPA